MSTFSSPNDQVALTRANESAVNNLDAAVAAAFALLPSETRLRLGTCQYAIDIGAPSFYVVKMPQTATAYVDGMLVSFLPSTTNTGVATLNVDGLGAKSIVQYSGAPLNAGDIVQGAPVDVRYSAFTGFFHRTGSGPAGATGGPGPAGSVAAAGNGSLGAPAISFATESTTGIWLEGAGKLAGSIAGSYAFRVNSSLTAWGLNAGTANTIGTSIVAVGNGSLAFNSIGNNNTAVGDSSLAACVANNDNTAVGKSSLAAATADNNVAVGSNASASQTSGTRNVTAGYKAGDTGTPANKNTTGSDNTWVGYQAGPGVVSASSLQNSSAFGSGALSMKSNQFVLGNASVTEIAPGSDGNVKLGSPTAHFKGFYADYTITATVGAVTINKPAGNAILPGTATSVTVTNSLVTPNSIVMAVPVSNVAIQGSSMFAVSPAAGSFTINIYGSNWASNVEFRWFIVSTD